MLAQSRVVVPILAAIFLAALCIYCTWPDAGPCFVGVDPDKLPAITIANARRIRRGMTVDEVIVLVRAAPGYFYSEGPALPPIKCSWHTLIPTETYDIARQVYQEGGPNVYRWTGNDGQLCLYVDPKEGVTACAFFETVRPPPPPLPWHVRFKTWLRSWFKAGKSGLRRFCLLLACGSITLGRKRRKKKERQEKSAMLQRDKR
jgi:hypothetical protein